MTAAQDARNAVGDFANAFAESNESSKSLLTQQLGALARAALAVGSQFADLAFVADPLFSGVTDPYHQSLIKDNFSEHGSSMVAGNIQENTGNRLNKLFEQAKAATWNLFQMGPDFFYKMMSQSSSKYRKTVATALVDAAALSALATVYNTYHQALDRTDLNSLNQAKMLEVKANTQTALVQMDIAMAQSRRQGAIQPATVQNCVDAIGAMCAAFTNPGVIIAHLFMQDVIAKIDKLDRDVQNVMALKSQFARSFTNTLTADVGGPIGRAFSTVRDQLAGGLERLTALTSSSFNKFSSIEQAVKLCQQAHVFIQGLLQTPAVAMAAITASGNFGAFNGAADSIGGQQDTEATEYLEASRAYRQVVQSVMVANVLPQLATKTATLLTKITNLSTWLAAQEGVLVALPIITSALGSLANEVLGVAALDRTESLVQNSDMRSFSNTTANSASRAGKAAEAVGAAIEELPISQDNKKGALSEVRSALLAIEAAQVIATEAMLEETPGAIGDVDSQTEQVQKIQEQTEVLLS